MKRCKEMTTKEFIKRLERVNAEKKRIIDALTSTIKNPSKDPLIFSNNGTLDGPGTRTPKKRLHVK